MVTLDSRKLTALLLAQAAAFVVVLVIGLLTGHKSPSAPSHTGGHSNRPGQTSTHSTDLTVEVSLIGGTGAPRPTVPLEIIKDPALTLVVSADMAESAGVTELKRSVPAGDYQVCVNPPRDWTVTGRGIGPLLGWHCTNVDARSRTQTVTLELTFSGSSTTVPVPS